MIQYNVVRYQCGCIHAYKWDEADHPHHRAHHAIDNQELHQARIDAGRYDPLPTAFVRKGCAVHWDDDVVKHSHNAHRAHHREHEDYHPEYHETGFTVHYKPREMLS